MHLAFVLDVEPHKVTFDYPHDLCHTETRLFGSVSPPPQNASTSIKASAYARSCLSVPSTCNYVMQDYLIQCP